MEMGQRCNCLLPFGDDGEPEDGVVDDATPGWESASDACSGGVFGCTREHTADSVPPEAGRVG